MILCGVITVIKKEKKNIRLENVKRRKETRIAGGSGGW